MPQGSVRASNPDQGPANALLQKDQGGGLERGTSPNLPPCVLRFDIAEITTIVMIMINVERRYD